MKLYRSEDYENEKSRFNAILRNSYLSPPNPKQQLLIERGRTAEGEELTDICDELDEEIRYEIEIFNHCNR